MQVMKTKLKRDTLIVQSRIFVDMILYFVFFDGIIQWCESSTIQIIMKKRYLR